MPTDISVANNGKRQTQHHRYVGGLLPFVKVFKILSRYFRLAVATSLHHRSTVIKILPILRVRMTHSVSLSLPESDDADMAEASLSRSHPI